ncbi:MAG: sugar ABC transporter permease [Anaerolineae bacterium]|nr:sugar ABC transporter permease [Anaerolineae bacterium]
MRFEKSPATRLGKGFWRSRLARREALTAYAFISPWVIGFLLFTIGPMIFSLYISFTDWDIMTAPYFVGLENYREMFSIDLDWNAGGEPAPEGEALTFKDRWDAFWQPEDDKYWLSMWNTLYYTVLSVPLGFVISLAFAMLLNQRVRGLSTYRAIFTLPTILPLVASTLVFVWLLNPNFGLINAVIQGLGGPKMRFLSDAKLTKPSVILITLWTGVGNGMIIFLAGLQSIPEELYDSAAMDGAGRWARFRHITIPMLSPIIFFQITMGIIGSFQVFQQAYVLGFAGGTQSSLGGPANSLLFYVLLLYQRAFLWLQMGRASAMAWILFIIVVAVTLVQFKVLGSRVYYAAEG